MSARKGKVQTVLGLIESKNVGITLNHEHLKINFNNVSKEGYRETLPGSLDRLRNQPIRLDNLYELRRNCYLNDDCCNLNDSEAVKNELKAFKLNGGSTIVDNSTIGLNRDVQYMKKLSLETGVNIVAPTGFYIEQTVPEWYKSWNVEKISDHITSEIIEGIKIDSSVSSVKAGVIGEIGCSFPLMDFERHQLQAAAVVQRDLGAPIIVHPGRDDSCPEEIVRILLEAGAIKEKVIMSHMERTFLNPDDVINIADLGCIVEYDFFGVDCDNYVPRLELDMMNDGTRIKMIRKLIDAGHIDRISMSHDLHLKPSLTKYGGPGLSHILVNIVPKMLRRGFTQEEVDKMLRHNPAKWLEFTV